MKFTGIRTSRAGSGCKRIQVADIAKRAAKRTHLAQRPVSGNQGRRQGGIRRRPYAARGDGAWRPCCGAFRASVSSVSRAACG